MPRVLFQIWLLGFHPSSLRRAKEDPQLSDQLDEERCHDNQSGFKGQEVLSGQVILPGCQAFENQIHDEEQNENGYPSFASFKEKYHSKVMFQ